MRDPLDDLRRSVQALALDAKVQLALFPDFVVVGDELVLDFGDAWDQVRKNDGHGLNEEQLAAIEALDRQIDEYGRSRPTEFWLTAGVRDDPEWDVLRALARGVLSACVWPNEVPQIHAVYVKGP